jgi:hypothetical protein
LIWQGQFASSNGNFKSEKEPRGTPARWHACWLAGYRLRTVNKGLGSGIVPGYRGAPGAHLFAFILAASNFAICSGVEIEPERGHSFDISS